MRKDVLNHIERIKAMDIKINYSELARKLGCDPRTIKNYALGKTKETRKKTFKESKLKDFEGIIDDKVENFSATAFSIFKFLQKKGYTGQYGIVKNYVREYKKDQIKKATIRFETTPGLQAQVDFKERKKMFNRYGKLFIIDIFLYTLGYSRWKYLAIVINKSQKMLINCLINAFQLSQGVPEEILFDNIASVVDRHSTFTGEVQYNKKFLQFAKDFNFNPLACRPYRAQTKGKVEALSKLTNRLNVYNKEFETIDELQKIVEEVNKDLNNEISQAINTTPNKRLEIEQKHLLPLPNINIIESYVEKKNEYKVTDESMIKYFGNKYSVPTNLIGKDVEVRIEDNGSMLKIYNDNDLVVSHLLSDKLFNYKREHVIEILKSDAFKHSSLEDIESVIDRNLKSMDVLIS